MKNVVIYSPDFSLCYSLLMYLQNRYKVTTTTDLSVLTDIIKNSLTDLVVLDSPPSDKIYSLCKEYKTVNGSLPLVMTYVYNKNIGKLESLVRSTIDEIFYKPFDLNEFSTRIPVLMES